MTAKHYTDTDVKTHRNGLSEWWQSADDKLRNFLLAVLITTVTTAVIWAIFPPHFTETNDDIIMASFAYGYMGEYTDKLVFINILIGKCLKFCIRHFSTIPWYALFQCGIVYASFTTVVYLILQKFGRKLAAVPVTFVMVFFGYEFFSSLQFTKTAASAVVAGMLLLFYAVSELGSKWYAYVIGGLLVYLGSLYRFRIFEMLMLLMFGVGLILVWKPLKEKQWKQLIKICLPFVIVFAICFSSYAFDRWTYAHTEGWENFWSYNYLRDNLQNSREDDNHSTGFPDYYENIELYESLGITENDYYLYCTGNFADTELFTRDVVKTLVEAKHDKSINLHFLKSFVLTIGKGLLAYTVFPAVCIVLLLGLLSMSRNCFDKLFLLIYEVGIFSAVQFYFYYRGRYLQSRTDVSVIFGLVMILLFYVVQIKSLIPTKRKMVGLLCGACLFSMIPTYVGLSNSDKNQIESYAKTEIHSLMSSDESHFYFCYANWSNFPDKMYDIWHIGTKGCGKNRSALGTWRVSTQTVIDKMSAYQISNPYHDLIDNDNLYLLCVNDSNLNLVLTHIREHYNSDAYAVKVKNVEDKYPIYLIVTEDLDLDVESAENVTDDFHYEISKSEENGNLFLNGFIYKDNENSFASNIYVGVVSSDGTEKLFYTTQNKSNTTSDNMNGEYGSFTCDIESVGDYNSINLYIETSEGLFAVKNVDVLDNN